MQKYFFNSKHIKLVLLQTAHLSIFLKKSAVLRLLKEPVQGHTTERLRYKEKEIKNTSAKQDSNLKPFDHHAYALLLYYTIAAIRWKYIVLPESSFSQMNVASLSSGLYQSKFVLGETLTLSYWLPKDCLLQV